MTRLRAGIYNTFIVSETYDRDVLFDTVRDAGRGWRCLICGQVIGGGHQNGHAVFPKTNHLRRHAREGLIEQRGREWRFLPPAPTVAGNG